ncbi:YvaD family protein [Viridibacillus sp. FSL R5-0477]|uniref:Putative membrane protein YvaD n=1 Tax=Viridibacillus arenosi FSL R5-213 TaxID=1227360 RepID=W4ENR0_9BACL|nr:MULTISPECIES: YvaD family protein [Viridibacillus]ETT81426.1 putative membrane protein YvaD [Viridibacillus arenosi FSL R5-213]OMC77693.1 hypothetical protein BK130_21470 [Viridibacillus sp. FSL H8-0123]OMC89628.1 hypothetical protein BK137_16230 [Viridibacillus arenosi]
MKLLKPFFLVTDVGFILYWIATYFYLIPKNVAFKDYDNPMIIAWNWSFFPLDILISITGLYSLYLCRRNHPTWESMALISLVLTFCSGLQAIAFWAFIKDFDFTWWLFNLYLMIYPLFFMKILFKNKLSQTEKSLRHSFKQL